MSAECCISCLEKNGLVSVHEELTFDGYTCRESSAAALLHECFNIEMLEIQVLYAMCSACLTKLLQSYSLKERIQHNLNSLDSRNEEIEEKFKTERINVGYISDDNDYDDDDYDDNNYDNLPLSTFRKSNTKTLEDEEKKPAEVMKTNNTIGKSFSEMCNFSITTKRNKISDNDYKMIAKKMSLNGIVLMRNKVDKSSVVFEESKEQITKGRNGIAAANPSKTKTSQMNSSKSLTSKDSSSKSLTSKKSSSKSLTCVESSSKSPNSIESSSKSLTSKEGSSKSLTSKKSCSKYLTCVESTSKSPNSIESSSKSLTSKKSSSKSPNSMENSSKSLTYAESSFKSLTPKKDSSESLTCVESSSKSPNSIESSLKSLTSEESSSNTLTHNENGYREHRTSGSHALSFNEEMQNEFKSLRRDALDFYIFSWYNSKYHCSLCEQKYGDVDDFKAHTRQHSVEDTDFFFHSTNFNTKRKILKVDISSMKCKYCGENVTQPETFRNHLSLEHNVECKDIFRIITPYNLNKSELKCVVCYKVFFNIMMLTRHMNEHYANFICSECGTPFLTAHRLSSHRRSKHVKGVFECKNHCDRTFETPVKRNTHMRTVKSGRRSLCPLCPEKLTNFYAKMAHLAKVHNEEIKKYKCEICPQKYVTAGALKSHVRKVHLNERNHVCSVCGDAFFSKVYLRDHMVKHNGEKIFHCEVCDKSFTRKSSLRIHKWVHKSYKRFVCHICSRRFAQNGTLKTHLKVHLRPRTRRNVEKVNKT